MATSHASDKWKLYGGGAEVQPLPNSRYRVTIRCQEHSLSEDWYYANKANIFKSFGDAYDLPLDDGAGAGSSWTPADGEEYPNLTLIDTEYGYIPGKDTPLLSFVYETLTGSWANEDNDLNPSSINGLRVLEQTQVATSNTPLPYDEDDIGVVTKSDGGKTLYLVGIDDKSTERMGRVILRWSEAGILSETIDNVGSQKSKVIETTGADPTAPTGYSLASKQESNFEGFQTNRFTFLKDNVELSRSEDKVGSQLSITTQVFNPADDPTIEGYSLAREEVSDVDGIPTKRYTFLKEDVKLSESEDEVGSQNAITEQWFKPIESSDDPLVVGRDQKTDYSLARREESDVGGIPTERYTFLKDNVELSRSSDLVGSQKSITTEVFKPTSDPTESGYSVARTEVSDVEGIPTKRYTFLKDNVILSESEDMVGSQLAITREVFNGTPATPSGYSLAKTEESDIDGIPTKRYTFLKNNVVLSVSEDKVGSQRAVVNEVFNPTSEDITGIDTDGTALSGYSEANRTESDYEGIKTIRVQFLKPSILSLQQDFNNGLKRVSVQAFGMTDSNVSTELTTIIANHKLISQNESDYEGIKTSTFQYQIDESLTEDYELNGLKRISLIELSTSNFLPQTIGGIAGVAVGSPLIGLYLGSQNIDNGGTIKTRESVWAEKGILSVKTPKTGGQQQVVVQALGMTSTEVDAALSEVAANHVLVDEGKGDYEGFQSTDFTFQIDDFEVLSATSNGLEQLERTELRANNFTRQTVGTTTYSGLKLISENIDNGNSIKLRETRWAEKGILSVQTPKVGGQQRVVVQALGMTEAEVTTALSEVTGTHKLVDVSKGDYNGLQTLNYTFEVNDFEVLSATSNGLEQLERTELSASDFTRQTVGTATYSGLKLISENIDNGNFIRLRETQWTEDGILSISSRNMSEGVQAVETVFLADEGATVGPVYARETRDYEGLKTIRVTTLQDKDGNSIIDGGENLVHRYERKVPFTYPGVVSLNHDIIEASGTDPNLLNFELDPPVEAKVDATVSVIFQTSGSIVAADEEYDDGTGAADSYWNPTDWAKTYLSGVGWSFSPFVETQGLRGYRVNSDVSGVTKNLAPVGSITLTSNGVNIIRNTGNNYLEANSSETVPVYAEINGTQNGSGYKYIVNGRRIYGSTPFTMRASGGPVDPSGTKYVLDIDIRPAFEGLDGNIYYKKTIVTATV